MNTIKIYGPGCVKCTTFAELTKQAMRELQLEIPIEKVTDAMQFAVAGVLLTPALSVNGKILISGKVPTKEEIKNLLLKEKELWQDSPVKSSCSKNNTCGSAGCSSRDGAGCCEGSSSSGCNKWKKAIVWIVVLLTLLAVIKILNHQETSRNTASPATATPINLVSGLELVYYEYGARCPTCIRMEKWTNEAIGDILARPKKGNLIFRVIPADEKTVQQYELTTKSLILKEWKNGKEIRFLNLDRIWELSSDEQAFKTYIIQNIQNTQKELNDLN